MMIMFDIGLLVLVVSAACDPRRPAARKVRAAVSAAGNTDAGALQPVVTVAATRPSPPAGVHAAMNDTYTESHMMMTSTLPEVFGHASSPATMRSMGSGDQILGQAAQNMDSMPAPEPGIADAGSHTFSVDFDVADTKGSMPEPPLGIAAASLVGIDVAQAKGAMQENPHSPLSYQDADGNPVLGDTVGLAWDEWNQTLKPGSVVKFSFLWLSGPMGSDKAFFREGEQDYLRFSSPFASLQRIAMRPSDESVFEEHRDARTGLTISGTRGGHQVTSFLEDIASPAGMISFARGFDDITGIVIVIPSTLSSILRLTVFSRG